MYRYRCDQCCTTSPVIATWVELLHERDRHRRIVHGGHVPDGEHLLRTKPPRPPSGWRPARGALILLGLWVLEWIARHV